MDPSRTRWTTPLTDPKVPFPRTAFTWSIMDREPLPTAGAPPLLGVDSSPSDGVEGVQAMTNVLDSEMDQTPALDAASFRRSYSPSRPPTSAEIDAVIAAAIANAPPAPPQPDFSDSVNRSITPLMTNLLPSAVGADGRVNLFVGNLPYRVRWQDLKDLFRKAGTVLRADVSLGPDNRSRGYGTVLMGSREDAARAIDRFNGYIWQTRTLEVRPDRMPPEYEPQPHTLPHHNAPRPPLYGFHGLPGGSHPPFPLQGHLAPPGPPPGQPWHPAQLGPRPPPGANFHHAGGPPPSQPMLGHLPGGPGGPLGVSPHGHTPVPLGASPGQASHSPQSLYGTAGLPLPLAGQNTGGLAIPPPPIGASPLAGSLTAGPAPALPVTSGMAHGIRRDSLTPFAHSVSPDLGVPHPRSASPALAAPRPTSSSAHRSGTVSSPTKSPAEIGTTSNIAFPPSRAPPPGGLGPLPLPPFGGIKAVISPSEAYGVKQAGMPEVPLPPHGAGAGVPSVAPGAPLPASMEGLANQGMGLGPPNNLHDRVVFVSNLPLTMQWQDLKDMLRPAGLIIRADIAQDDHRKPRGYGTALFATEADASRAVGIFNGKDIGGRRIRVYLERDSHIDLLRRDSQADISRTAHQGSGPGVAEIPSDVEPSSPPSQPQPLRTGGNLTVNGTSPEVTVSTGSGTASPIGGRLPWGLNTAVGQVTPVRYPISANSEQHSPIGPHAAPGFRHGPHPGPIAMPPFAPMDSMNPLSPLQTRGLPPMTPSMPGFVFNAFPETPPVHPHFFSPGVTGPFSPGIPVTSPTAYTYNNPFLNAAPGAPVNRFPQGGSAQLGTPTTQAFPNNPIHGYGGPPGGAPAPHGITQAMAGGSGSGNGFGQEYFPPVVSDSPTPRNGNHGNQLRSVNSASPLNAKERMASSTVPAVSTRQGGDSAIGPDELARRTGELYLGQKQGARTTPESPTGLEGSRKENGQVAEGLWDRGRQSLDEHRPSLSVEQGERRASFGDIGGM